jgi:hypothetical protein
MQFDDIYDVNKIPQVTVCIGDIDTFFDEHQHQILKNTVIAMDYIVDTPTEVDAVVMLVNVTSKSGELIMNMDIRIFVEDMYSSIDKLMQLAIKNEEYEIAARIKQIKQKINIE